SDTSQIKSALRVAYLSHQGQMRKSGEPFIIHPISVAILLTELSMDVHSVMAGLLHDTVEDTDLTFAEVEALFGQTVRKIVEGETKVSKLPKLAFSDYADEQAENLRQMFVAMTDDYRIIIVKLADRLHNMRTLRHMKPAKQQKIARETLDIFAPLAHRMGIWQFKSELEDTAFMYLYPLEYKRLNRKLRRNQKKYRGALEQSKVILEDSLSGDKMLEEQGCKVAVSGRTKELYSLWLKMETKYESSLDKIADVVALRVVLEPNEKGGETEEEWNTRSTWLCYHVLGLVQHLPGCQSVPTSVKDYISFPKPNGYQSLHTALICNGQTVEVQIRTSAMHRVAEVGMAAHWAYQSYKRGVGSEDFDTPWLSSIKEWQQDHINSRDFVESVRRELLGKRVFVFLRNGKILNLARGATAIDAAFQIHTEVGLNMHGVEINGLPVSMSYELQNGDVVNVLTGEGRPALDWMRYAKARSTRAKLRGYFRAKQRQSLVEAGGIILSDFLETHHELLSNFTFLSADEDFGGIPREVSGLQQFLPGRTRFATVDELCVELGKRHNRQFLRKVTSQILKVPLSVLNGAESDAQLFVGEGAMRSFQHAIDKAVRYEGIGNEDIEDGLVEEEGVYDDEEGGFGGDRLVDILEGEALRIDDVESDEMGSGIEFEDKVGVGVGLEVGGEVGEDEGDMEYADPDHLCPLCMPVRGDDILGTRPVKLKPEYSDGFVTVHRRSCKEAQTAHENSLRIQKGLAPQDAEGDKGAVSYRQRLKNKASKLVSVPLVWNPYKEEQFGVDFLCQIQIYANDRKLLLSECSEIVSDNAFIVKTGSSTSGEHAMLEFLIKVKDLEHVQVIMDEIMKIRSVMSVERKFGGSL
ncbi:hypothetical protein TrRE_jg11628, partial [Triparma retinervis]